MAKSNLTCDAVEASSGPEHNATCKACGETFYSRPFPTKKGPRNTSLKSAIRNWCDKCLLPSTLAMEGQSIVATTPVAKEEATIVLVESQRPELPNATCTACGGTFYSRPIQNNHKTRKWCNECLLPTSATGYYEQVPIKATTVFVTKHRPNIARWSTESNPPRQTPLPTSVLEEAAARREEAREAGLKHYFAGHPCKYGHNDKRLVSRNICVACIRECGRASRAANPEAARAAHVKWRAAHPKGRQGNVAIRKSVPGSYTADEIRDLFKRQNGKCAYAGILPKCAKKITLEKGKPNSYECDHIIPLTMPGSTNLISNIQLTCKHCNRSKRDADPIVFARRIGRLL